MSQLLANAKNIKLFAFDVDGIFTDGRIIYDSNGAETKTFYVQDGLGVQGLMNAGITVALITGRTSSMVDRRAQELGIHHVIQGQDDKLNALTQLAKELDIPLAQCAYMGDDLIDVTAISKVGLGVSVPNGCDEAKAAADYITTKLGGSGAVREICDLVLKTCGYYDKHLASFGIK